MQGPGEEGEGEGEGREMLENDYGHGRWCA